MKKLIGCLVFMPSIAAATDYVEAVGTAQITSLENTYPAWLSDGRFVHFATGRDGNPEVYRMRADGSQQTNLSRHPGADGHPRVSADIRRVTDLPDWDTYPVVSPDGSQLLWRRIAPTGGKSESGRNPEVFWMNLATGERRNVTDDQAYDGWPAWSPDGRRIAFASNRANAAFEAFDIYVANADGSHPVRVTFGDGQDDSGSWTKPSFSADGQRILCTRSIGTRVDIFVITLRP